MLSPPHSVLNFVVPSVLGDLDGGCSLRSRNFGSRRWRQWGEGIDQALEDDGLMTEDLALLLAGALMGQDGEICEREGEGHTSGLLNVSIEQLDTAGQRIMRTKPVVKPMVGAVSVDRD